MTLTLSPAKESDFEALWDLRVLAMSDTWKLAPEYSLDEARAWFAATFEAGRLYWVVLDGRRIGTVTIQEASDHILVRHLVVHPSGQGRGAGTQIMRLVIAKAAALRKALKISVYTKSRAVRFYTRLGFVPTHTEGHETHMVLPAPETSPDGRTD